MGDHKDQGPPEPAATIAYDLKVTLEGSGHKVFDSGEPAADEEKQDNGT